MKPNGTLLNEGKEVLGEFMSAVAQRGLLHEYNIYGLEPDGKLQVLLESKKMISDDYVRYMLRMLPDMLMKTRSFCGRLRNYQWLAFPVDSTLMVLFYRGGQERTTVSLMWKENVIKSLIMDFLQESLKSFVDYDLQRWDVLFEHTEGYMWRDSEGGVEYIESLSV